MNELQQKVCLRARYLVDKNEGAVNRMIHGGESKYVSNKKLIDEFEKSRAKIAESEFALPVEEYMGKVHDISLAKDAAREAKRQKLLSYMGKPSKFVEAETVVVEESTFPGVEQKERSKAVEKKVFTDEKFKGRERISRDELIKYILKNAGKKKIGEAIAAKKVTISRRVPDEEIEKLIDRGVDPSEHGYFEDDEGYRIGLTVDRSNVGDFTKKEMGKILEDHYASGERVFSKAELYELAGLHRGGVDYKGILSKKARDYSIRDKPDPLLAEQAAAAKDNMPVDKSASMSKAVEGLKNYHRFRREYIQFPQYQDVMDRKKTMADAFKIYKKLAANYDHIKSMKKLHQLMMDVSEKHGGYGQLYSKKMASLARKGVTLD